MGIESLYTALDDAIECSGADHLSRADRLAIALWWLIESIADEFAMPEEAATDEVVMLCEVVREMMREAALHPSLD